MAGTRPCAGASGEWNVPQIWMTYDELAALLGCDSTEARSYVAGIGLDRRRSRDGQTRAKLNSFLTDVFFDSMQRERLERQVDTCIDSLKGVHEQMTRPSAATVPLRAFSKR